MWNYIIIICYFIFRNELKIDVKNWQLIQNQFQIRKGHGNCLKQVLYLNGHYLNEKGL